MKTLLKLLSLLKKTNSLITPTANNNIFLWLLSYICLPISYFLNLIRLSPNVITFLSFLFLVIACKELIQTNLLLFSVYLVLSIIFDICDGQVARISKKINKLKLNIDHFSDIVKISLLFLSFGILFNKVNLWIIIFITNSLFLFFCILHSEVASINRINLKKKNKNSHPFFFKYFKKNTFYTVYKILVPLITTFNVHSLLLFLLILIDLNFLNYILTYFILLFLHRIQKYLIFLSKHKIN